MWSPLPWEIQRRLKVWRPRRAAVIGAGTVGLLATMALRLRGLRITTFALRKRPYLNSDLVEATGARYYSVGETPVLQAAQNDGKYDLIFEASGYAPAAFEAMQAFAKNGVLVLSSVTGGNRKIEVPADRINLDFVLGNKVHGGHRERQPRALRGRCPRSRARRIPVPWLVAQTAD